MLRYVVFLCLILKVYEVWPCGDVSWEWTGNDGGNGGTDRDRRWTTGGDGGTGTGDGDDGRTARIRRQIDERESCQPGAEVPITRLKKCLVH